MARKYDLLSEQYERTAREVVESPEAWESFLRSACRNFKLRFDEQLLIYEQRPDATAVLEIERWNRLFGRWVNRGAQGIAVFEEADRSQQRLKYYFDISDTHESRRSQPVPLWQMRPAYEAEVTETLENTFGMLENKESLAAAIESAAKNACEDNIPDYVGDLLYTVQHSFMEGLNEDMVASMYRKVVRNSVAYMMMTRLGLDTEDYFERKDFAEIVNFNTMETLNALGFATSDIAEMALTEIARTITALDKQNRIVAEQQDSHYNEGTIQSEERSHEHEQDQLYRSGSLPAPGSDYAEAAGSESGAVRPDEAEVSEGTPSGTVLQPADKLSPDGTPGGGGAESLQDGGDIGTPNGSTERGERGPERDGYAGVGPENEQSEELSPGDRVSGSDLRLNYYDREHEDKSLPFLSSDDDVNAILLATPHLKQSKSEIRVFLESRPGDRARTEFIKSIFNNDYTEVILPDGRRMGYKTFENVLHLWEGSYLSRTKQAYYDWGVIAGHFEGLRLLGELQDNIKPLPSMDGQQSLIEEAEERSSAFSFSQEIIDAVLARGSGISEGKMRIYEQFQKSLSAKENAAFLKNEYGWGGTYPIIVGTGVDELHDGKGIHLSRGHGDDAPKITLTWTQVEKRIAELIRLGRYLNPKEQSAYPNWLAEQEERRREAAERRANQEVLSTAPPEKETEPEVPTHYEYHLGDTVYLGAQEFEILSFDDQRVMLHDVEYPLFQREETRKDFDRMVAENPMNNHLKVRGDPEKAEESKTADVRTALERAKSFIDAFCREEYGQDEGADYSDLTNVGIAYTTTEDDKHEIQVSVDLVQFKINTFVDNKLVGCEEYVTLENLIHNGLTDMSFDELTSLSDEQLATVYRDEEKAAADMEEAAEQTEPPKPTWEQKKRSRVQTFDLHPDIPMADRLTFDLAVHEVEKVGKKDRFYRNLYAIQVLQKCREEGRFATHEEQIVLSKYVGWGGLPEAFDEGNSAWETQYLELKTALTPEEYATARESTLTAFYTPPGVIQAIYKVMERMGFKEGNILEPSCGIGNFIGMLPPSMQEAKVYGVEMDKVSAGIAQQLYQRSSIAALPFEETNIPDSFFDMVAGNIPFGDFSVADKRYDKHHFLIHDYFLAKSLDKLRPGGVMALVTSKGTMDKASSAVRKYIAQRADLLGAIRLPNNTFKGNAGTEVVSDILILQKRDRLIDIEPDWVHLDTDENGLRMNSYFVQHPEMVLGEAKMVSGRFGDEMTVIPYEGADLESQLGEAISNIHGEVAEYEMDEELAEEDNSVPADPSVRNFSYTILDDKIYYRENSRMAPVGVSATAENRIKGMIQIRGCVRLLLEMQTEDYPDETIQETQQRLNQLYDSFTKKYGLLNSRANVSAFSQDSSFSLLSALEVLDEDGQLKRKADIFSKRTIKPHVAVTSVETASEALAVSIAEKARIDMGYMSDLSGKTEKELFEELKGVIFLNPKCSDLMGESKYLMADEYLSGNVREKLAFAKKSNEVFAGDYDINIEALEKVQPKDLSASEIFVRLGATWVPPEIIQQFIYEFLDTPNYAQWNIKVHYSTFSGQWNIEGKSVDRGNIKAHSTYGTQRINAYKIIEETLNLKDVRIFDYVEDADGKKKPVLNAKETAIAQAKQEQIKQGFQDWAWADPQRRELLCKIYNDKFNSTRPREYDGSHITFAGMNPEIELREHQKNAVAHILYGGNTLLAHAVGAGKTYEMAAAAMESKRLGLCSKPLFVVPNHLTEQWAAEFLQLYPAANILVATKKDFETKNRKRFCGRIATGDYDAVIIGHSQFEKIPMSVERQVAILEQERDEIMDGIAELKANRGEKFSIKQMEKSKKAVETKLKKLNDQSRKDDIVTFEELGVDRIFIDESHYYKNLYLYTKMRNVGGIAQAEAQKSSDLFMKCRYLDELTGGRGTVFATGTPISNSMVELYTIQRYLQYNTLAENGLQHFDSWASSFGETVTAVELKPEGTGYRTKTRFSRFYNLPELMAMFKEVADIKTADMLDLPVPEANYHNIVAKPSEMQQEIVESLGERAEKVRNGEVNPSVDNMLRITNDGRKLALDQRMINPMLPDFEGSKVNACVENVYQIWASTREKRSAQLVFCDLSTPKADGEFSVYTDIRKKLIERGIPAEEVRFIHEADTEVKKQEMFRKVRTGEIRVLLGSTQRMGAGTNCQDKLIALHDIDCPWRPSDLEQRSGRIIRQGNENPEVDIYRYVTEGTFDAYLYQLVEGKQKFASQIMTSKSPVRSAEDIDETALSYAEIKMLATGNPHIKEKMDLDNQVQKLRLLKSSFLSEKYALEDKIIKFFPREIARIKGRIETLEADVQTVKNHPKPLDDRFVGMKVSGTHYTERAEAGRAIIEACREMSSPAAVSLGEYRGFKLELQFNALERSYEVATKGAGRHIVTLGDDVGGNITRIDNLLERFEVFLSDNRVGLEEIQRQFEIAKVEAQKPFSHEEELKEKTARLDELNIMLNLDKPENELAGDEPDEDEIEPERKEKVRKR